MPDSATQVWLPPLKGHPHIFILSAMDFPSAIPQAPGLFLPHSRPTHLENSCHTCLGTISYGPGMLSQYASALCLVKGMPKQYL